MALPVLNAAKYKTVIPSQNKEIEYRPYLVKEEKILMIALESKDSNQILGALKDVIVSCVYNDIDADELTMFDLEALFLKLRSKSVGEKTEVTAKCDHCETENKMEILFDDIEMPVVKNSTTTIELTKDVGVVMSYPKIGNLEKQDKNVEGVEGLTEILIDSIDSIYDADDVYPAQDSKREELKDFIDSLNSDQFSKLTDFFTDSPSLKYDLQFKCKNCGKDNDIELRGLDNFFG
jgi:ribosomal protein L44E